MKAVVIREYGGIERLVYEEVETPVPGPGEVLVRLRSAGVNHLDHDVREGMRGNFSKCHYSVVRSPLRRFLGYSARDAAENYLRSLLPISNLVSDKAMVSTGASPRE